MWPCLVRHGRRSSAPSMLQVYLLQCGRAWGGTESTTGSTRFSSGTSDPQHTAITSPLAGFALLKSSSSHYPSIAGQHHAGLAGRKRGYLPKV